MGIRRTIMRCRERFFWPKMNDSVTRFIQNCEECSRGKYDTKQTRAPLKGHRTRTRQATVLKQRDKRQETGDSH